MILGIGTDIIEINRIQGTLEKYGERFKNKMFTQIEIDYCEQYKEKKYAHYAARFAAKEAFSKAIGTGFARGFNFKEIYIQNLNSGEPTVVLEGKLKEKYGENLIKVSLSHTDNNAIAYLIMESK
ncbi:MAG: holo-[acyl-carrier-protein] synthase [Ignavibacteriae bacterium HGW-Ignavibacteriae-4]|jgi:holo-[acyl-carrier protein] synthase|nr:MAG: holo-[acyl-carrier-protein] synthase [Ignavibacteriae bacterium HGW-Ignavibacteriae-4]